MDQIYIKPKRNTFRVLKHFSVLLFILLGFSCTQKSEYELIKKRELESGKIVENLFLDLRLGMGKKEFYGTCWEHNKNGILTNGSHNLMIQYKPEMPSGKNTNMFFYPDFEDNKLYFMPIEFIYTEWFPGNEEFTNDKLIADVVSLMEDWFGKGFFEVTNKNKTIKAIVKIDGNRLVRIFKKDVTSVRVEILDLRVKNISDMAKEDADAT